MSFQLPTYSSSNLWGPLTGPDEDEELRVFSKAERIGRLADWQVLDEDEQKKRAAKMQSGFREVKNVSELKELKRATKEKTNAMQQGRGRGGGPHQQGGRGGAPFQQQQQGGRGGAQGGRGGAQGGRGAQGRGGRGGRGRGRWQNPRDQIFIAPTLKVGDEVKVRTLDFPSMYKAPRADVRVAPDIAVQGKCAVYDPAIESATAQKPVRLPEPNVNRNIDSAYNDPVVREFVTSNPNRRIIFGADTVIAKLMTAHTTMNSFDVQANSNGKFIALLERNTNIGKLATSDSRLDYEWVNETATQNIPTEEVDSASGQASINSSVPLAMENAFATRAFHTAVKSKSVIGWTEGGSGSPYKTNTIFRYRHWVINAGTDEETDVIVRCEIDAATKGTKTNPAQYMKLFTLLEGPPHEEVIPWRNQADKPAALLIKATNNNRAKVSYWAALSLLANVDVLKIALVNRTNLAANKMHDVIGVATCPAREFAGQLGIDLPKLFTNLNTFAQAVFAQSPAGKHTQLYLMREPKTDRMLIIDPTTAAAAEQSSSSDDDSDSDDSDSSSDSSDSSDDSSDSESD